MYFYLISIFEDVAGINLSCTFVFFFLYRCQKIIRINLIWKCINIPPLVSDPHPTCHQFHNPQELYSALTGGYLIPNLSVPFLSLILGIFKITCRNIKFKLLKILQSQHFTSIYTEWFISFWSVSRLFDSKQLFYALYIQNFHFLVQNRKPSG
jgi:hypothetical protein